MPRKRTASARMCKVMAARIARPATIAARIEALEQLNDRLQESNGNPRELKRIAAEYRELGAKMTAAEIEKGL